MDITKQKREHSCKNNRVMLNGMHWIARSGVQWWELPENFWQLVYNRFAKWRDDDTLKKVFRVLSENVDTQDLSIKFTCIKVYESANGREKHQIRQFLI